MQVSEGREDISNLQKGFLKIQKNMVVCSETSLTNKIYYITINIVTIDVVIKKEGYFEPVYIR